MSNTVAEATPSPKAQEPVKLSRRYRRFVHEYLKDFNASAAARRCKYSERSAPQIGHSLLKKHDVRAEIDRLADAALDAMGINRESTLLELGRIGKSDIRKLFDANGNLKPMHELDDDTAAALASVKVLERKSTTKMVKDVDGDNPGEDQLVAEVEQVREVKLWSKIDAFDKLARIRGWVKDKTEVTVKTDLADLIREVVELNRKEGYIPGRGKVELPALEAKPSKP